MDKKSIKSEIMEKIGIDQIIGDKMDQKDPDAIPELDEKDIAKIKKKMAAELEQELDDRLNQKIEEQVERKMREQERKAQLKKALKKACSIIAAGVAVYCSAMLVINIFRIFFGRGRR